MTEINKSTADQTHGSTTLGRIEADPPFVQKELGQNNFDTDPIGAQSKKFFTPRIPDFSNIPASDLMKIKAMVAKMSKDARKKSIAAIYKDPAISTLYSKALGRDNDSEEMKIFLAALPMSSEAFVLNFMAEILGEFDLFCKSYHNNT